MIIMIGLLEKMKDEIYYREDILRCPKSFFRFIR